MPLTASVRDQAVTFKTGLLKFLSLNTDDPSTTGTNEVAGITRQPITWAAVSNGSSVGTVPAFTPGAATVKYASYWSAATGGTFLGSFQLKDGSGAAVTKTTAAGDTITVTPTETQTES